MAEFLLELYVARSDAGGVAERADRARAGAAALTGEGTPVRFLRSLFVPAEETCFLVYEAPSADAVRAAATRALLPCEHVAELERREEG